MSSRPNFFVGIRLASPAFSNAIVAIQNQVLANAPSLAKCRMDPKKLHLTTFVLCLQYQSQIDAAAECLRSCQEEVTAILSAVDQKAVTFQSIGSFTDKVLYAEPVHDDVLTALVAVKATVEQNFMKAGLLASVPGDEDAIMAANSKWTPHATIMKLSYDRKNGRKLKILPKSFAGCERHFVGNMPGTASAPPATATSTTTSVPEAASFLLPGGVASVLDSSTAATAEGATSIDQPGSGDPSSSGHCIDPVPPRAGLRVPLTTIDLLSMQQVQADGYYRSYAHITLL